MSTTYQRGEWRPPGDLPEPPYDLPAPGSPEEIPPSMPEGAPPEPTEIPSVRSARDRAAFGKRRPASVLALLCTAALAQSCAMTPVVWTKSGVERSAAQTELDECRALAADQMWRMTWEEMWPPSFYDPRFMPRTYMRGRPFWIGVPNSLELERSLTDFCMYSKGYRLGPSRPE